MTKKEARDIVIDLIWAFYFESYGYLSKSNIDDNGTLSKDGYEEQDIEKIQKEFGIIADRVSKMKLK